MKRFFFFLPLPLLLVAIALLPATSHGDRYEAVNVDINDVKDVVVAAYVKGMHTNRDPEAARAGFHEDFVMHVNRGEELLSVSREDWVGRLKVGEKNPAKVEWEFKDVNVTGDAAHARLAVFMDGEHVFTDYFGLYRMEDGWKIVNKIFQSHR